MGILPVLAKTVGPRTRRWDVVIVGSGLTALVTAARLGMAGQRVLIVEESAARDAFPGLREPFFCAGLRDPGVLASNLRELGVPLIERRRLEPCACAIAGVARTNSRGWGEGGSLGPETSGARTPACCSDAISPGTNSIRCVLCTNVPSPNRVKHGH